MKQEKWIPTCCNACGGQTGIMVKVQDDKVVKIEPNSDNPIGVANIYADFIEEKKRGARMCPKGNCAVKQLYNEDRLTKPLKRVGERGDNCWQEISWEEALDYAAEKLAQIRNKYGAEKLLWFSEDHAFTHIQQDFCRAFGTPNYLNHANLCDVARKAGFKLTLGDERPIGDLANTDFMLFFGWNPLEATKWAYLPAAINKALGKGAKLVVIDPVFTATAAKAYKWVPIRPGTDGALALALGNVIVTEKLYNKEFVDNWTIGFAEYKEFIKDKTPEWAEKITGIEAETITMLAKELAKAKSAVIDTWSGTSHYTNGTEATRAIAMLIGLLGQVDRPGAMMFTERKGNKHRKPLVGWPKIEVERIDGVGSKYPFAHKSGVYIEAREAMLTGKPYEPKAAVFCYQNFAMSVPNIKKNLEALSKLEFIMVFDPLLSETAMMADLVIPGAHFLERYDLNSNWVTFPCLSLRQPVVKPYKEVWPEYEFIMTLARELGFEGFNMSYEDYLSDELEQGIGISLEELKELPGAVWIGGTTRYEKYKKEGFKTPSSKFEFYSRQLLDRGFNPLPEYQPTKAQPNKQYPLYLINWKRIEHTHTRSQNNPWLMEMSGGNSLYLNPVTAERMDIHDGEQVIVESAYGQIEIKARITPEVHPEVVGLSHGFGHTAMGRYAKGKGAADNWLYAGLAEHLSGQAVNKEATVRVYKTGMQGD